MGLIPIISWKKRQHSLPNRMDEYSDIFANSPIDFFPYDDYNDMVYEYQVLSATSRKREVDWSRLPYGLEE